MRLYMFGRTLIWTKRLWTNAYKITKCKTSTTQLASLSTDLYKSLEGRGVSSFIKNYEDNKLHPTGHLNLKITCLNENDKSMQITIQEKINCINTCYLNKAQFQPNFSRLPAVCFQELNQCCCFFRHCSIIIKKTVMNGKSTLLRRGRSPSQLNIHQPALHLGNAEKC